MIGFESRQYKISTLLIEKKDKLNLGEIKTKLDEMLSHAPQYYKNLPIVLDLSFFEKTEEDIHQIEKIIQVVEESELIITSFVNSPFEKDFINERFNLGVVIPPIKRRNVNMKRNNVNVYEQMNTDNYASSYLSHPLNEILNTNKIVDQISESVLISAQVTSEAAKNSAKIYCEKIQNLDEIKHLEKLSENLK